MLYFASIAAAAFAGLTAVMTDTGAAPNDNFSLDAASDDLIFEQIVENAVADCREELAGDVFANFRLKACVDDKVAEIVVTSDAPQLADYAAAHQEYLLTATAP